MNFEEMINCIELCAISCLKDLNALRLKDLKTQAKA